jgi:hypothetical protein
VFLKGFGNFNKKKSTAFGGRKYFLFKRIETQNFGVFNAKIPKTVAFGGEFKKSHFFSAFGAKFHKIMD